MNEVPTKLKVRAARKNAKRGEKKRRIADSAIEALKELGYANTSLRDIAAKSDLSLGMLHYYFEDRSDLIIYCVQVYKAEFVRTLVAAIERAEGREEVIEAFSRSLAAALLEDTMTHRLWYDIRTQAMFDAIFRPVVRDIEAKLIDLVRRALIAAGHEVSPKVEILYALLDGVFFKLMQDQFDKATHRDAHEMTAIFRALLEEVL